MISLWRDFITTPPTVKKYRLVKYKKLLSSKCSIFVNLSFLHFCKSKYFQKFFSQKLLLLEFFQNCPLFSYNKEKNIPQAQVPPMFNRVNRCCSKSRSFIAFVITFQVIHFLVNRTYETGGVITFLDIHTLGSFYNNFVSQFVESETQWCCYGTFIANLEQVSNLDLVFLLLKMNKT